MAGLEATRHPVSRLPTRGPAARRIIQRSRIQPQTRDHRERMTVPRINGDPFSATAVSVAAKFLGHHWDADKARAPQRVRDRAGTIVAAVMESPVPAAIAIRFGAQLIRGPDRAFHRDGGVRRSERHAAFEARLVSRHGRTGRRERTGEAGVRRGAKDRGANQKVSKRDSHRSLN